jgi:hypothetical protein
MSDNCRFCERGGIPLMPVRLALATSDNPVPVPKAPFVSSSAGLDNDKFQYVMRTLRAGYLYVYDEARSKWAGYVVTPDGYYFYFDPGTAPPAGETIVFSCSRTPLERALASCITIEHTKNLPATRAFLAFSDVAWTPAVFAKHQDGGHREKSMRWINLAAWIGSHKQTNCETLEQADTVVSEYTLGQAQGAALNTWNPFAFASKAMLGPDGKPMQFVKALVEAAKQKDEALRAAGRPALGLKVQHGAIVSVSDPAGIVRETAKLLQFKTNEFMTHPSRVRQLALSNAISAVKSAIADQAVKEEIAAAEDLANQQVSNNPLGHVLFESTRRRTEEVRHVSRDEAARARAQSWGKYARKLRAGELEAFEAKFSQDLADFDATWVFTLADFHAKWLRDPTTQRYFEYNFDPDNISNGFAYQALVSLCFEDMADKKPFALQCKQWFEGNASDKSNLLLRGLVLNNDQFAAKVTAAAGAPFDARTPGWENVGNWFKEAFMAVDKAAYQTWLAGKGPADVTARFFVQITGPLIRLIAPQLAQPSLSAKTALLAMGISSNAHIVPIDVVGSKKAFREALVRQLIKSAGQKFNGNQLKKAVADELRRLEVEGVALEGQTKQRWLLAVNEQAAKQLVADMPAGLSASQRAQRIAAAIVTPEALEQATSPSLLRTVFGMEARLGVLSAALQSISLSKAMEDETKAMAHETQETKWKLRAAWMGLAGTIVETTSVAVGKMPALTVRAAQGINAARGTLLATKGLAVTGRAAGALAGFIVAVWDGVHTYEEASQRNWSMASLYFASAATGGVLAIGLAAGLITGGVAIILLIVLVALAVLIELFKDNKIQDWLERTLWGTSSDRYESMETEQKQLEAAVAG